MTSGLVCPTVSFGFLPNDDASVARAYIEECVEPVLDWIECSSHARLNIWFARPLARFMFQSNYRGSRKRVADLCQTEKLELLLGPIGEVDPHIDRRLLAEEISDTHDLYVDYELPIRSGVAFAYPCAVAFDLTDTTELDGAALLAPPGTVTGRNFFPLGGNVSTTDDRAPLNINLPYFRLESSDQVSSLRLWCNALSDGKYDKSRFVTASALQSVSVMSSVVPSMVSAHSEKQELSTELPFRYRQITERYLTLTEKFRSSGPGPAQRERLLTGGAFLRDAHNSRLLAGYRDANAALRALAMRFLISAEVEFDYAEFPEVDPTIGWVHFKSVSEAVHSDSDQSPLVVDSQLSRILLSPTDGSMLGFEYKPRKVDLSPGVSFARTLRDGLCLDGDPLRAWMNDPAPQTLQTKMLRAAPDFLTTRFTRSYEAFESVIDIHIKAGITAFNTAATTGLEFEYWLNRFPSGAQYSLSFFIQLPTLATASILLKPLTSASGVSQQTLSPEKTGLLRATEVPGGLHGLRLIDSVQDMAVDLRSAKQLNGLVFSPIVSSAGKYQGIFVELRIDCARIDGDDKANTIFLSVVS